eukprot:7096311-Pyramimonas_sp.AAC.1
MGFGIARAKPTSASGVTGGQLPSFSSSLSSGMHGSACARCPSHAGHMRRVLSWAHSHSRQ